VFKIDQNQTFFLATNVFSTSLTPVKSIPEPPNFLLEVYKNSVF